MRERAQARLSASCWADEGGGEDGAGKAELGKRMVRRVERSGDRSAGGWR